MSDEAGPPIEIAAPHELRPETIQRWSEVARGKPLAITLTAEDLDELMMGLRRNTVAQMELGEALRAFSNGKMEQAEIHFVKHQINIRDGYSNFNRFIEAVMSNAKADG